jgi:hypothetical protein
VFRGSLLSRNSHISRLSRFKKKTVPRLTPSHCVRYSGLLINRM